MSNIGYRIEKKRAELEQGDTISYPIGFQMPDEEYSEEEFDDDE